MGEFRSTHARIQGKRQYASGGGKNPSAQIISELYSIPLDMPDAYKTLGVKINATTEEISEKFKEDSRKYHPDT